MKKVFKVENLDCANCALKVEDKIRKIHGVLNVSINFITGICILEAVDNLFDKILDESKGVIRKIEPDSKIVD